MKKYLSLTAAQLRILALGCMLLDHLWATVVPGNDWMTMLGRIAFPIFAFQAAEGYHHTHDFRRYCLRLGIFALISEIPFNLMVSGSPIFPWHQNVMLTLLLGLGPEKVVGPGPVLAGRSADPAGLRPAWRPDGAAVSHLPGQEALAAGLFDPHQLVRL